MLDRKVSDWKVLDRKVSDWKVLDRKVSEFRPTLSGLAQKVLDRKVLEFQHFPSCLESVGLFLKCLEGVGPESVGIPTLSELSGKCRNFFQHFPDTLEIVRIPTLSELVSESVGIFAAQEA